MEDFIKENEDLRKILLAQEGGIMKYWAEHPDVKGRDALFEGYQSQCADKFFEANMWSISEEDARIQALGYDRWKEELTYLKALNPALSDFSADLAEQAKIYVDNYLKRIFIKYHHSLYPDGISPKELYNEVIREFNMNFGVAAKCLRLVLQEYRGIAKTEKDDKDLFDEFLIGKCAKFYSGKYKQLRQAVKERIDSNTKNLNEVDSRRICRKLFFDDIWTLKPFARWVNGDYDLVKVRQGKGGSASYTIWSTKDLELLGIDVSEVVKQNEILISKEEMKWLREGILYYDPSHDSPEREHLTLMQTCFINYYRILTDIGRIWAAQLLVHGIDMRDLEKNSKGCCLNKLPDLLYYVDRFSDDFRDDCCVYSMMDAKELLDKIKKSGEDNIEKKNESIMKYVGKLKDIVDEKYQNVYVDMWNKILQLESVKNKVYNKGKQQDTIFNRDLVANIIHLMKENGIFKKGTTVASTARLLEPEKGVGHPVRAKLGLPPDDTTLVKEIKQVICSFKE